MIGIEPQYLQKMLLGLGELALLGQKHAQVIVRHDIAGSELERSGIVADGLGNMPLVGQGSPQVMMGFSIVGLEADRFAKVTSRDAAGGCGPEGAPSP